MKIAYCIEGFYNHGGMERIISVKANWLVRNGYNIDIIVASQCGCPPAYAIDNSISLIDLNCDKNNFKSSYRLALSKHLNNHDYDITISTGGVELFFLKDINDKSHKIVELHFAWNRFFTASDSFFDKAKSIWQTVRQIKKVSKLEKVVLLTHNDEKFYNHFIKNTVVIHNPLTIIPTGTSFGLHKTVIAVGRLEYQKGFDMLIKSWVKVARKHPDWELNIFGSGCLLTELKSLIDKLDLSKNVHLKGFSENIGDEFAKSSINVCSSRSEGFSLAIAEASAYGVPSISFDCVAGPSELIDNGKSGILVKKVGDTDGLADAICTLIEDEELRKSMSKQSIEKVKSLNIDNIMHQWVSLFKEITNKKGRR